MFDLGKTTRKLLFQCEPRLRLQLEEAHLRAVFTSVLREGRTLGTVWSTVESLRRRENSHQKEIPRAENVHLHITVLTCALGVNEYIIKFGPVLEPR